MDAIRCEILAKGAEAVIFKEIWYGIPIVRKVRMPKAYRDPRLDRILRQRRTINEARLLYDARKLGVSVPAIMDINLDDTYIMMEYIEGVRLRDILNSMRHEEVKSIMKRVGVMVGMLHVNGIVHGDLTTSNMILTESGNIFLIDFGLGMHSDDIEDLGVDLHIFLRALESTHTQITDICFKSFLSGYERIVGNEMASRVVDKIWEIRARGRYVSPELRK
ncbi:MAG: Kae1-associated kinase Bud32 [Thermoprotei archaeon]|mgnify:CR=1 FL=1|nr:MAG: Kae1-associated kinase Bud32 [Thermoprotei archaeon]